MTHASCAPAGNGSQWPLMAAELLQSSPAFRESMHACAKAVAPYGLDLLAEMVDPEGWKSSAASASGLASVQVLLHPLQCNVLSTQDTDCKRSAHLLFELWVCTWAPAARRSLTVLWGFVLQVGLVDMLREEYGVTAAGCFGHSAGLTHPACPAMLS